MPTAIELRELALKYASTRSQEKIESFLNDSNIEGAQCCLLRIIDELSEGNAISANDAMDAYRIINLSDSCMVRVRRPYTKKR